jgi:hypothetical protein
MALLTLPLKRHQMKERPIDYHVKIFIKSSLGVCINLKFKRTRSSFLLGSGDGLFVHFGVLH